VSDPIIPEAYRTLRSFAFGDNPDPADELLDLVLKGESDRSLACWRDAHRRYFGRLGKFSEDMMLMCERFRLVEIFEGRTLSVPSPLVGEG
jgi:uncharacterized protein YhfF